MSVKNGQSGPYASKAGYIGALSLIFSSILLAYLKLKGTIRETGPEMVFGMVAIAFVMMLLSEFFAKRRYNIRRTYKPHYQALSSSYFYLLKSTFFRFIALFAPFYVAHFTLNNHYYFVNNHAFQPTVILFNYFMTLFLTLVPLYLFITLRFRGERKYEYNDYAVLSLIGYRSLFCLLFCKKKKYYFFKNRRVKKVFLVYLVNFFFVTLMGRFIVQEYQGFEHMLGILNSEQYTMMHWYNKVRSGYFTVFHMIFIVDIGIALIGYVSASRWLDNRTRSVDMTLSGWMVALFCYPPFNDFFSGNFISYAIPHTEALITSQGIWSVIFVLLIIAYSIYAWGTIALGFKFSNLTNRGIVTHGPYKYVRHPAYTAKNFAWLIDNTHVFSNVWAALAFFAWNAVYVLRGLTEERHLSHDPHYRRYQEQVKYKFIPKII